MITAATLSGCTGGSEQGGGDAAHIPEPGAPGAEDRSSVDADGAGGDAGGTAAADESGTIAGSGPDDAALLAATRRSQVFRATQRIRVDDLRGSTTRADSVVTSLGGFSAGETIELGEAQRASVTYRVPATEFDAALDGLGEIGELESQEVQGEDVTAEYADLEGRVTTLRASIARLQSFLSEATDVGQIGLLEGELTARESELESIESRRRALADQIDLSTITVSFVSETAVLADQSSLPSFLDGLETGWKAAVSVGSVLVAGAGFVLPFLPLLAVLWLAWRWRARRSPVQA